MFEVITLDIILVWTEKGSSTQVHACMLASCMDGLDPTPVIPYTHLYTFKKGIMCGQTTTASVTQNLCRQLNEWAANLVSTIILWTGNSCEVGTGTLFFDLHYKTKALQVGFTDNFSSKFEHKVWLRHIYTFSIIMETWNANTV